MKTLCFNVRILSANQIASHWFKGLKNPLDAANKLVWKLEGLELVNRSRLMVCVVDVGIPLLDWNPALPVEIDFEKIAYKNQTRWNVESKARTVVSCTSKAAKTYGGGTHVIRQSEVSHDLAVTDIFLSLKKPEKSFWKLEDELNPFFGLKKPDAVIQKGDNPKVIEVVGKGYGAQKIKRIVDTFGNYGLELR